MERWDHVLKSMTGFGSAVIENDTCKVQTEIKAVNQRYLDLDFRMAREFSICEEDMCRVLKKHVARGKLSIYISVTDKRPGHITVTANHDLARAYQTAYNELGQALGITGSLEMSDFLKLPGIVQPDEAEKDDSFREVLMASVEKATAELLAMRLKEGAHLKQDFLQRLTAIEQMICKLEVIAPEIVNLYRERLQKLLEEARGMATIDDSRLLQEVALFGDKVNFTEEVVRLKSHIVKFREAMELEEPVGRKLDFLLQEMNREANTIGSKANNASAAHIVVDIKSEIDKIREQVQNIE